MRKPINTVCDMATETVQHNAHIKNTNADINDKNMQNQIMRKKGQMWN